MTERNKSSDTQLKVWTGEFGQAYLERNPVSEATVGEAREVFRRIITSARLEGAVDSVLEVGANIGINLHGLRDTLGPDVRLSALEPNPAACKVLRDPTRGLGLAQVLEATAYEIPLPDASVDLVFTNGVLIHIPPAKLIDAMREIHRVARRFVLCSEYFAHSPEEIAYRGHEGLLWKRDFGRLYLETFPDLFCREYGFLWNAEFENYDDLTWWVLEKRSPEA